MCCNTFFHRLSVLGPLMLFALRGGFAVYYSFITVDDDDDDSGVHWIHEESFCVVGLSLSPSQTAPFRSRASFSLALYFLPVSPLISFDEQQLHNA